MTLWKGLHLSPFFFPMCLSVTGDKLQVFSLAAHHQNHSWLITEIDQYPTDQWLVFFTAFHITSLRVFYGLNVGMVSYDAKIT